MPLPNAPTTVVREFSSALFTVIVPTALMLSIEVSFPPICIALLTLIFAPSVILAAPDPLAPTIRSLVSTVEPEFFTVKVPFPPMPPTSKSPAAFT